MYEYSALFAKIKAMYGKRLRKDDYEELIRKKNVGEIAAHLKKIRRYEAALADINPSDVHRRDLERHLKSVIFSEYFRLSKFVFQKAKGIFDTLIMRYEIDVLKSMLWLLDGGKIGEFEYYLNLPDFLDKNVNLPLTELATSKDYSQFMQKLRGTKYEKPLLKFMNLSYPIKNFDIEMALDQYYFHQILNQKNKAGKSDKKVLEYLVVSDIDLMNMLWIYRSKFHYGLSKESVYNLIIPYYHKLSRDTITSLVESPDAAAFMEQAHKTGYARVFESTDPRELDMQYKKFMLRLYERQLHRNENNFGIVISYLSILEVEIKNIISIIEGIRYSLEPEQVREYLLLS